MGKENRIEPPSGFKTCEHCQFLGTDQHIKKGVRRVCRRNPPAGVLVEGLVIGLFPIVDPEIDWCGDFVWQAKRRE